MKPKYPLLLSPLDLGNGILLRNRIMAAPGTVTIGQGAENWPTEIIIQNYANKARSGAAVVCCKGRSSAINTDNPHRSDLDIFDPRAQHYFAQMSDAVRSNGARASIALPTPYELVGDYDVSTGVPSEFVPGDGSYVKYGKEAPKDLLERISDFYAHEAATAKMLGFNGCYIHMAYRIMFPGRFLSPHSNIRTDEYGGCVENRVRFPLEICKKIKDACGKDFLIEVTCSGEEPEFNPGVTIEDTVRFAQLAEGLIDILQIRASEIDHSQNTYLDPRVVPHYEVTKKVATRLREVGCKTHVSMVGGCHDPAVMESLLEEGACDVISTSRSFIANTDFVRKIMEGREDDIVPCLRCNKCHQPKPNFWRAACSVNPVHGIEHKVDHMYSAPSSPRRIAIIGGGPAGMEAAIVCADRGHKVTLYEKEAKLGGQLVAASVPYMKWTVKKFMDYMVHQVEKRAIDVKLNTRVTKDSITAENYDVILCAVGAEPKHAGLPGEDNPRVLTAYDALLNPAAVTGDVVVIGDGEVAVETALHFAKNGHKALLLGKHDKLAANCTPVHFRSLFIEHWEAEPNFSFELNVKTNEILDGHIVRYTAADGTEKTVEAGTVLVAVGMKARHQEAVDLAGQSPFYMLLGDCEEADSIMSAMRNAYITAMTL